MSPVIASASDWPGPRTATLGGPSVNISIITFAQFPTSNWKRDIYETTYSFLLLSWEKGKVLRSIVCMEKYQPLCYRLDARLCIFSARFSMLPSRRKIYGHLCHYDSQVRNWICLTTDRYKTIQYTNARGVQ